MTETTIEDQEQARREYIRQTFGDDALEGLATDQDRHPRRTTAQKIDRRRRQDEQDQAEELAQLQVAHAAREHREDLALDRAVSMIEAGRTPDRATVILAARAQERHGSGLPSAETLAGPTLARLRRETTDDDDQARRQGRRPRG